MLALMLYVALSVEANFKCHSIFVSLAILQVGIKSVFVVVVRIVIKKVWAIVHAYLWWRHDTHFQAFISIITCKLAFADANAINLKYFKLTTEEKKCCQTVSYAFTLVKLVTKLFLPH